MRVKEDAKRIAVYAMGGVLIVMMAFIDFMYNANS